MADSGGGRGGGSRPYSRTKIPTDVRKARISRDELLRLMSFAVEEAMPGEDEDEGREHFLVDVAEPEEHFSDFVARHNPTLLDFEHVPRLVDVADRVVRGELTRVLIHSPPRYFKSEVWSRLLPAHFLRQFPPALVGMASYGAELAWMLSEEARGYYVGDGGRLSASATAKRRWASDRNGMVWATGAAGPMLGFGFHLGIVDDPLDPLRWSSPRYQRRFREWWVRKFLSRQEPGARIVLVMQRLGLEDPFDFLYKREVGDDGEDLAPEHWHVVHLDEIHSDEPLADYDGPKGLPPTCTLEPDPRDVGQVLAPTRFSRSEVEHIQRSQGPLETGAQRQGRPAKPEGDFWKRHWFQTYDTLPDDAHNGGWDWDLAYTKKEQNSASAGVKSYRGLNRKDADGKPIKDTFPIYVDDVDWDWLEFPEAVSFVEGKGGPHYIEAKASGKSAKQSLKREGIAAREVTVQGDKLARASNVQPVVANERIYVRSAVLGRLLSGDRQGLLNVRAEELAMGGDNLDVNDAFVQGITRHVGTRKKRVRVFTPSGLARERAAAERDKEE